uniref:Uncharacterized protein n=1 Tax=Fagus sylvatica TaxID=28930 RepID=A0A2N9ERD5_FAGSY
MQHDMTRFGILFPKGTDDHAHFALLKEAKGYWITGDHFHASLDPHGCGGREVDFHDPGPRYKGFVVEPVPAQPPPESGFDPKIQ